MSGHGQDGLLTAIARTLAEEASAQARREPHAQRQSRAGYGAALLSGCYSTFDICGPGVAGPLDPRIHMAWWGCAALGALLLLAGLFGRARGPVAGGFGLLVETAGLSWLLWNRVYPAGMPRAAFLLHSLYLAALCACLAQIAAALVAYLPGRDALALVERDIAEDEFSWEE
jgi:hypothetical protein